MPMDSRKLSRAFRPSRSSNAADRATYQQPELRTFGTAHDVRRRRTAPVEIFAADMNGDTIPDIISVDSTPPGLAVGAATGFDADEVAVLLSQAGHHRGTGGTGTGGHWNWNHRQYGTTTPPTTTSTTGLKAAKYCSEKFGESGCWQAPR